MPILLAAVTLSVALALSCAGPASGPAENTTYSIIVNSDTVGTAFGPAQYQIGLTYFSQQQYQEALKAFSAAIKNGYGGFDVHLARARAYNVLGMYSGSIGDAATCLDIDPQSAAAYQVRGYGYLKTGEYAKATADFTKALEIDPSPKDTYFNRAMALRGLGQFENAIQDLQRAIAIDPGYLAAVIWLGRTYYSAADYYSAIEQFSSAIELNPTEAAVAYNDRAVCLATTGDLGAGLADLNIMVGMNPAFYKAFYNRGVIYMKMVQPVPALEELDTYLCLDISDKYGCRDLAVGWRGYYPTFFVCCYDPAIAARAMDKCNRILAQYGSQADLPYTEGALYFQSEGPSSDY